MTVGPSPTRKLHCTCIYVTVARVKFLWLSRPMFPYNENKTCNFSPYKRGDVGGGGGWDGDITILEIICRCVDIFSAIRLRGGGGIHLYWKIYLRKKFTRSQNMTLFVDVFVIYWSDRWRVMKSINKEIQLSCSHAKTFQRK